MSSYTPGFKARMVQRMVGREAISASALANEVGVAQSTLSRWLRAASVPSPTVPPMAKKKQNPSTPRSQPRRGRTAEDKLRIVLDASGLSEGTRPVKTGPSLSRGTQAPRFNSRRRPRARARPSSRAA